MNDLSCVIGLEVHVQLRTPTKIFSPSSVEFEAEPNRRVDVHCLGLPGTLPVLSRSAVEQGLRLATALDCRIAPVSWFDRKNYFYPDLPKNYQITQQRVPLATGGRLPGRLGEGPFPLERLHLEEDAGRSKHRGDERWVDLNRAGTPLAEIVTPPAFTEPEQAGIFLHALRDLVRWLGVSDGNMEEGSLRCDANLSVCRAGTGAMGTRVEIKNLNSIRAVVRALEHERDRQSRRIAEGGTVRRQTRGWDAVRQRTTFLRGKESTEDYRYFPDPDLPPLVVDEAWRGRVREKLGELPWQCRRRLAAAHGLDDETLLSVTDSAGLAAWFESLADRVDGKLAATWVKEELRQHLHRLGAKPEELPVGPPEVAELLELLTAGRLTHSLAKEVLAEMIDTGRRAEEIVDTGDRGVLSDAGSLGEIAADILHRHPEQVAAYRGGKTGLLSFFMGQAMARTAGRADPAILRRIFLERLEDR